MSGTTGLFSFCIRVNSAAEAEKFADSLRHIRMAVSWGGYESLIIPLCCFYDPAVDESEQLPYNMYRLSIGLEEAEVLIADLDRGFAAIS